MEKKKNSDIIDIRALIKAILDKKRWFYIVLPATFVLSCLYIICIPRYYDTSVSMAPEMELGDAGGTLGSLASTIGLDFGNATTTDAITPTLYPDLMNDNKFVSKFFDIKVENADGSIKNNYYDYLLHDQKYPWWKGVKDWMRSLIPKKKVKDISTGDGEFNPYILSRRDAGIIGKIQNKVIFGVDKKTGVITISVRDQDRLICKTVADSACSMLQQFITEYRTNKARNDVAYYQKLTAEAKETYEKARRLYGSYADSNNDIVLESYRAKQNDLENDMQLKYNNYTAMVTQYQAARAKVQERTPAFTVIKGASVPIRPSGPKRMIFVLGMLIMATFFTMLWAAKDVLLGVLKD